MQEIITAVTTVGFPIVMCLLIFYSNEKTLKELKETISALNTTMEKLLTKVGKDDVE